MSKNRFKIYEIDNGFCRVTYQVANDKGTMLYYCIQDEGQGDCKVYRCTDTPWCEPLYEVELKLKHWPQFEVPVGNDTISCAVREFIESKLKETA